MLHALIVEDDLLVAIEIQTILEKLGFNSFDIVFSPPDAVASAQNHFPDLITADYWIENGTGVEAVERILEFGRTAVVYITANIDQVRDLGEPIVEKPVTFRELALACAKAQLAAARPDA